MAKQQNQKALLVKESIQLYWQQVKRYKVGFFVMVIAIPISGLLLNTIVPYLLSQVIGEIANKNTDLIYELLVYAGVAGLAGVVFNLIGFQVAARHESKVRTALANDALESLLEKDRSFFGNQRIGALTGKFIDYINGHVRLQELFVFSTLSFGVNLIIGVTLIALQAPYVALLVLGLLVFLSIQIRFSRKLREPIRAERKRLVAEANGLAADVIGNSVAVQTFAQEKQEAGSLAKINELYRKAYVKDFSWMSIEGTGRHLLLQITQLVVVAILVGLVINGELDLAIGVFVFAYLQRLSGHLFALGEIINGFDAVFLQSTPMAEILLEKPRINDAPNAKDIIIKDGHIQFDAIDYAYHDNKHETVLHHLSLDILSGQKIGLVGLSGAGKTTLAQLLLRFDDVTKGSINIDGQSIHNVTQSSLRRAIAYVPQEPLLFHRSLRENIAYADPDANDEQVIAAAKRAHAWEFIDKMPNKLDTVVGERGVKLSGGQRQRIAIARAILKNAPILVLDEATSALDSESEKLIQASLDELMKGRTSIVIAHRLSTIAKLDRIIVLDNGRIVEDGPHATLLKKDGIYANLWSHQSGGFIEE